MQRRNILAYSDKLFTPSESFIPRGYKSFDHLKPVFIGHEQKGPTPDGFESLLLGDYHGITGEAGFKQFGLVSPALETKLRSLDPIAIHASFGKSGAYALPLARKLKLPLIVTYYGGDATKTTNTKDSFLRVYNRRRDVLWREADLILPCSEFIRRELEAKGAPTDKMVVHHNTADPERFNPGKKEKIILFAGRWTEKKGIETLIDALSRLGGKLDGWRVRLLGDGELKTELVSRLQSAGVTAELPGWIPADEMPGYFSEAMIVCVPSQRASSGDAEGLPLVCVEAMLSECALAATYHAGIPECVKDGVTGYLVEERDSAALSESLEKMISDPVRTLRMGKAGREFALEHFNLVKQSQKLQELIINSARKYGTLT
jgi:glycosyltransferase involved in cell wall biosynthesis